MDGGDEWEGLQHWNVQSEVVVSQYRGNGAVSRQTDEKHLAPPQLDRSFYRVSRPEQESGVLTKN